MCGILALLGLKDGAEAHKKTALKLAKRYAELKAPGNECFDTICVGVKRGHHRRFARDAVTHSMCATYVYDQVKASWARLERYILQGTDHSVP